MASKGQRLTYISLHPIDYPTYLVPEDIQSWIQGFLQCGFILIDQGLLPSSNPLNLEIGRFPTYILNLNSSRYPHPKRKQREKSETISNLMKFPLRCGRPLSPLKTSTSWILRGFDPRGMAREPFG